MTIRCVDVHRTIECNSDCCKTQLQNGTSVYECCGGDSDANQQGEQGVLVTNPFFWSALLFVMVVIMALIYRNRRKKQCKTVEDIPLYDKSRGGMTSETYNGTTNDMSSHIYSNVGY